MELCPIDHMMALAYKLIALTGGIRESIALNHGTTIADVSTRAEWKMEKIVEFAWLRISLGNASIQGEIQRKQSAFKDASALEQETHNSGTAFSNTSKFE